MTSAAAGTNYRPTESKYKGGAHEMYVTYDLEQKTRGGQRAVYHPKAKRVYIAGHLKDWKSGVARKRTGRQVHGVASSMNRHVRAIVEKDTQPTAATQNTR